MAFGKDIDLKIGATDKTGTAFKSAESKMKRMSGMAKSMMGVLGVGLGVAVMKSAVSGVIAYGSALSDSATATQTNVEALQVFRYAAIKAGASTTNMDKALIALNKAGIDAADGLATQKRAFESLGISVAHFNTLPTEEKFKLIARQVANAKDQNLAMARAMDIMGSKNAPKLMEVLQKLGKEGYGKMAEEAKKATQMMSEDTIKSLDDAADAIERFKTKMTIVIGEKILGPLMKALEKESKAERLASMEVFGKEEGVSALQQLNPINMVRFARATKKYMAEQESELLLKKQADAAFAKPAAPAAPVGSGYAMMGGKAVTFGPEGEKLLAEQMARTAKLNEELAAKLKESNDATANIISQIKINRS